MAMRKTYSIDELLALRNAPEAQGHPIGFDAIKFARLLRSNTRVSRESDKQGGASSQRSQQKNRRDERTPRDDSDRHRTPAARGAKWDEVSEDGPAFEFRSMPGAAPAAATPKKGPRLPAVATAFVMGSEITEDLLDDEPDGGSAPSAPSKVALEELDSRLESFYASKKKQSSEPAPAPASASAPAAAAASAPAASAGGSRFIGMFNSGGGGGGGGGSSSSAPAKASAAASSAASRVAPRLQPASFLFETFDMGPGGKLTNVSLEDELEARPAPRSHAPASAPISAQGPAPNASSFLPSAPPTTQSSVTAALVAAAAANAAASAPRLAPLTTPAPVPSSLVSPGPQDTEHFQRLLSNLMPFGGPSAAPAAQAQAPASVARQEPSGMRGPPVHSEPEYRVSLAAHYLPSAPTGPVMHELSLPPGLPQGLQSPARVQGAAAPLPSSPMVPPGLGFSMPQPYPPQPIAPPAQAPTASATMRSPFIPTAVIRAAARQQQRPVIPQSLDQAPMRGPPASLAGPPGLSFLPQASQALAQSLVGYPSMPRPQQTPPHQQQQQQQQQLHQLHQLQQQQQQHQQQQQQQQHQQQQQQQQQYQQLPPHMQPGNSYGGPLPPGLQPPASHAALPAGPQFNPAAPRPMQYGSYGAPPVSHHGPQPGTGPYGAPSPYMQAPPHSQPAPYPQHQHAPLPQPPHQTATAYPPQFGQGPAAPQYQFPGYPGPRPPGSQY